MPNENGVNQFGGFGTPTPVGKATELARSAPMSGAPVAAVNAPKQAQRKAVHGAQGAPAATPVAPPTNPSYHAQIAAVWKTLQGYAPNDPLIAHYAALAAQQAGKV